MTAPRKNTPMTLTPEAPARTHAFQVRTDPAGKPLAIRYDGRVECDAVSAIRSGIGGHHEGGDVLDARVPGVPWLLLVLR
jgi:hypothetical protein